MIDLLDFEVLKARFYLIFKKLSGEKVNIIIKPIFKWDDEPMGELVEIRNESHH